VCEAPRTGSRVGWPPELGRHPHRQGLIPHRVHLRDVGPGMAEVHLRRLQPEPLPDQRPGRVPELVRAPVRHPGLLRRPRDRVVVGVGGVPRPRPPPRGPPLRPVPLLVARVPRRRPGGRPLGVEPLDRPPGAEDVLPGVGRPKPPEHHLRPRPDRDRPQPTPPRPLVVRRPVEPDGPGRVHVARPDPADVLRAAAGELLDPDHRGHLRAEVRQRPLHHVGGHRPDGRGVRRVRPPGPETLDCPQGLEHGRGGRMSAGAGRWT
jgi:hypothetical protein